MVFQALCGPAPTVATNSTVRVGMTVHSHSNKYYPLSETAQKASASGLSRRACVTRMKSGEKGEMCGKHRSARRLNE